jgi:hypothetical protein
LMPFTRVYVSWFHDLHDDRIGHPNEENDTY